MHPRYRLFLIFTVCSLLCFNSFANVSITAATGGTGISADKSLGSSGAAYTTLGDIRIGSGATGDYQAGQSLVTFTLSAPANWQFQAATGSAVGAGNVTVISTVVTSSSITITFNTGATTNTNAITISGIKVQCTAKTILSSANITRTAGTAVIANFTNATNNNCGSLSQAAGTFVKLQLLLPGETAAPGTVSGKTGTPTTPIAGTSLSATVNSVDENWNLSSSTDVIQITASDANAAVPANSALSGGTKNYTVTLKTAGVAQTITATDFTNGAKTASISPSVTPGTGLFNKLQLLMPGETAAPGTATGKTGTPNTQTAGTSFNVTVNAVDANWNKVVSITDNVGISSSDINATLPSNNTLAAGTRTYSLIFKTAGARTVTATDITDGSKTLNTSPSTTVNTAAFNKIQILLPGETASAGSATGKTGLPTAAAASVAVTVTVNAVDAYWNIVSSTDVIGITSSDGAATLPSNAALVAGIKTFSVTLKTFGSQTITATDITDGSKTAGISASVTVSFGAFTKMQILMPGETAVPGSGTGKTGTPTTPVAGTPFNVTVNAVDANWYVITTSTDVVGLTSTDVNAVLPTNTAMTAGTATLSFTFKTAAAKTITATDITTVKTTNTSPSVTVSPAAFTKLQLLMTGESAAPGTVTGKTGTPTPRTSGSAFNVTVIAVDAYWNKVSVTDVINLTSNDAAATIPGNAALVGGSKTNFSVKLRTLTTTATITATDVTDGTKTANTGSNTSVIVGSYTSLQLLLPGETAAPGTATGKTGTPTAPVAGTPFNITVNAVDAGYNVITSATPTVAITTTDTYAVLPANTPLTAGTASLSFTFKKAGARTITATDAAVVTKKNTSPSATVVAGAFVKLQLLLPGEVANAGSATGKTGSPTAQSAGTAFTTVTVNAVDANWNKVNTVVHVVELTTTDAAAVVTAPTALVAGAKTNFSVNFKTLGSFTVTATDQTDGTKTADTSPAVTVGIGAFSKLQLLLPGETAAPGTPSGKTGTPTIPVAGTPFNVTVNAVDGAWNVVTTATDNIKITSTDLNAVLPANAVLVSGTKTFSVTLKTVISPGKTITASDVTNGAKTANTSPAVIISPGVYSKLQLLLPGETATPGTVTGKKGAANPPARGIAFTVVVNAVDAYYNLVNSVVNTVTFTSSDGLATFPAPTALVNGTKTFTNGVKIVNTTPSPLPTLTVTDAGITTTVNVPLGVTPTATTDYFRTGASGDWNNALTWESSPDNINWQDATTTPTNAANTITILNGTVATVTASVTVDQVVVESGAQLIVNTGTLTVQSGGMDVSGTVTNAATINTTAGTLSFLSGGKYQHNFTSTVGTIPTSTWDDLSTCEVIGYTSATGTMGGGNQTFGNFIWNCPNQNVSGNGVALTSNTTASVNNLTVISTGIGEFELSSTGATVSIRGNFIQSGGIVELNKTSGTAGINLAGDFSISGGTIQKGGGLNVVTFNGTTTQNYEKTGGTFTASNINFAVANNAILSFGESIWDGSTGTFTLNAGGTIVTDNADGFTLSGAVGSIQNTGARNYGTGGNFVFNSASVQNIGGLPSTFNNLTVNNTQGVVMPAGTATFTINGQLLLNGGDLDMGANILAVGAGFTNSGTGTLRTQNTSATPIPSGKTWNVPVEYHGTSDQTIVSGTYSNLLFSEAGTKTATSGTVTVTGNWSSSEGKIDLTTNPSTVQFTGTAQSLNDDGSDGGNGVVFNNITFGNSGTKTLSTGSYAVFATGVLTMAGTATLAVNNNLLIASDATGSGTIAAISSGASITGSVDVQRFVTGGGNLVNRGYRLLSSPVSSSAAPNSFYSMSFLKGSGSYITGPGGATNGFDVAGAQTMYLYRDDKAPSNASFTSGNYRGVNVVNNTPAYTLTTTDGDFDMPVGNGFLYFFRGNEGTVSSTPPDDVTLNALGVINQGQILVKNWFNYGSSNLSYTSLPAAASVKGFNLVGNPYPSSINWHTAFGNASSTTGIYAPDLENSIYIYNATTKNYAVYTSTSASTGIATGAPGGSNIIPAGQGFFVRATSTSAQLIFNESAKVNTQVTGSNLLLGTPVSASYNQLLRLQLAKDDINKDESVILFNNSASNAYKLNEDVLYLKGGGVLSLANLSSDNKPLAIDQLALPMAKQTQKIKLNVSATADGIYQLNLTEMKNIPAIYDIWLMDAYQKDSLDIKNNLNYNFNIYLKDTSSFGANRFTLVVKQNEALGYHLLDFNAAKTLNKVQVGWQTEHEADYTYFTLERSTDGGKTFNIIANVPANGSGTYSFMDDTPVLGNNQYRLKQEDINRIITYSKIQTVNISAQTYNSIAVTDIIIYPNPTNAVLNVAINKKPGKTTSYRIEVINSGGKTVLSANTSQTAYNSNVYNLLPGTYFVQVTDQTDNSLIGRASFIKL